MCYWALCATPNRRDLCPYSFKILMRPISKIIEYSAKLADEYNLLGLVTDGSGGQGRSMETGKWLMEKDVDVDPVEYVPDSCVLILALLFLLLVPVIQFQILLVIIHSRYAVMSVSYVVHVPGSCVPNRHYPNSFLFLFELEGQYFPSKSVRRRMMRSLPRYMVIDRSYWPL